jgi:hypothetical protein
MPSADFCAAIANLSVRSVRKPDTAQTSRGKFERLRRISAKFTGPVFDGPGLRGSLPVRPAGKASYLVFCSSDRGFAPRFLQTPPRDDALALC